MLDIERLLFNFVARAYSLWSVLVGVALVILDQEVYSPSLLNNSPHHTSQPLHNILPLPFLTLPLE